MRDRAIAEFIGRLATPSGYEHATDRELLGRFANDRDEAAFEILIRRHERLVRTAIARVLLNPDDAADALQATFLVLVRRAKAIDWRSELGPWLYGVAHRVAVRVRARNRRQALPLGTNDPVNPWRAPDPAWREACDLLHAELDRLPDQYRLPLLLCYLEGMTRDEAAAALGLTTGAVKGRVKRSCEVLRQRLARRGVTLSVGLFAASTSPPTIAAMLAGVATVVDTHSPHVEDIVREVTQTMTFPTLKLVALAFALLTGMACALGFAATTARPTATATAPIPKERPPVFLVQISSVNVILDSDGKELARFEGTTNGALSPDGSLIACIHYDREQKRDNIVIRTRAKPGESVTIPVDATEPRLVGGIGVWSRDGKRLLFNDERVRKNTGQAEKTGQADTVFWVYDLTTKKVADLKLPKVGYVTDWSPDGKRLLASVVVADKPKGFARIAWVNVDGTGEPEFVTPEDESAFGARLSPDGGRILYVVHPRSWTGQRLYVLDLATKKRKLVDTPGELDGFCWSPDSKRVAYTWQKTEQNWEAVPERMTFLITCDPDGGNRKIVTSHKTTVGKNSSGRSSAVFFYTLRDWR